MISVILCEGADDAHFLGYYLHKVSIEPKWKFESNGKLTELYNLPKRKNSEPSIYTRKNMKDRLAIWPVGSKDSFKLPIEDISKLNMRFPDFAIQNIFIISDRDKDDVEEVLNKFQKYFCDNDYKIELKNNCVNRGTYKVDDEEYEINIIPIILPFDEEGALETILLNQIGTGNKENEIIVNSAKEYVHKIIENDEIKSYLKAERLKLKSIFSSTIAIINPDHSTRILDRLLMSLEWENERVIKEHFGLIEDLLK